MVEKKGMNPSVLYIFGNAETAIECKEGFKCLAATGSGIIKIE